MLKNLRDKIFTPEDEEKEEDLNEDVEEEEQTPLEEEPESPVEEAAFGELPLLPLRGVVMYPTMWLPITVGQPRSMRLLDYLVEKDLKLIALAASKDPELEEPGPEEIYRVGAIARIHRMVRAPDGSVRLMLHGLERIRIEEYTAVEPFLKVRYQQIPDREARDLEEQALAASAKDLFSQLVSLSPQMPEEMESAARNVEGELQLAYLLASSAGFKFTDAQAILEADPLKEKLRMLNSLLRTEVKIRQLSQKIQEEAQGEMEKAQRDFYLRKQIEVIQRELGEENPQLEEIKELEERIDAAGMPEEAEKEARRELERMRRIPIQAPEYSVIKTYLDWMVSLPWQQRTEDNLDIEHARRVLDEDHYGLEDIKDRILEFLAVRKLRQERKDDEPSDDLPVDYIRKDREGVILCFVGPPGVGKTSLGLSIARAMNRKFVRLALGGIRDEAEIRGFRRTYIGSMPGRIIQSLRRIESRNPVFMLDEVDKLGRDFRGDPASALLEVLDPEQNSDFRDHYLDVPFDLSEVFFITTANWLDPIPGPLRDRMEIIELSSYTDRDKVAIAKGYLIPRQIRENSLRPEEISFDDEAICKIIREYTREAGVRTLERRIGAIARKVATRVAAGDNEPVHITEDNLADWLGRPKFFDEAHEWIKAPGVATGLAWTPFGGQVLYIEATAMPGKGRLTLTGHLGNVMKESAMTALSYVRSAADRYDIPGQWFYQHDIHVHVPAGAQPKDGPSAGIAIATALLSLVTGRCVREGFAMTGEITLRGKVTRIGGVREKVLAAHRQGLTHVILPEHNEPDLEDVPDEVREQLAFHFVRTVQDVWDLALCEDVVQPPPPGLKDDGDAPATPEEVISVQ
ncbi:MAG TPA: endopeptidase La [Anaerolineae bacterium]|nr:endopeptidase La [Anaerolineae bacterium]